MDDKTLQFSAGKRPAYAYCVKEINSSAVRDMMKLIHDPNVISFGGGLPSPESFPLAEIAELTKDVILNEGTLALQYGSTEGIEPLREKLIQRMSDHYGVSGLKLENLALLSGSQQGLDFMAKTFLDDGDVVFVESPTYMAAVNAFATYLPNIVGLEMDDEGISIEDLKKKLELYPNAKFLYTIPDFQNPTGRAMSVNRRKELLDVISEYPLLILEDNPYGELRYDGGFLPPLLSLDTYDQVVFLGTFSKILAPGLRMGWVAGPADIVNKFMLIKQSADLQCNSLSQFIINAYLDKYDIDAHIQEVCEVYKHRRDVMLNALEALMPEDVDWTTPHGGLFLWLTFPEDVNASELLKLCVKNGVAYVPGEPFFADGKGSNCCRINFSYVADEQLIKGVSAIAESLKEYRNK